MKHAWTALNCLAWALMIGLTYQACYLGMELTQVIYGSHMAFWRIVFGIAP